MMSKDNNAVINTLSELPEELNTELEEVHCTNCGRFLGLHAIVEGTWVTKCRKCKYYTILDVHSIDVINSNQ